MKCLHRSHLNRETTITEVTEIRKCKNVYRILKYKCITQSRQRDGLSRCELEMLDVAAPTNKQSKLHGTKWKKIHGSSCEVNICANESNDFTYYWHSVNSPDYPCDVIVEKRNFIKELNLSRSWRIKISYQLISIKNHQYNIIKIIK